ncbi:MAG: hypothetical protein K2L74_05155 [Muribaculaceae bacterium]|nr:hypothetical protein [Muribaculaceae bacterium]
MELVVLVTMLLVGLGFALKLTFHGPAGRLALCAVAALTVVMAQDWAITRSKTQIAEWLESPGLMLDTAVLLTVDVAMQLAFCWLEARRQAAGGRLGGAALGVRTLVAWVPGLLIFPVLMALLAELVFAMPGVEFSTLTLCAAAATFAAFAGAAALARLLLLEADIRLELMFLLNILIASLGVVATVNGRTVALGTNSVEWGALAAVGALLAAGTLSGACVYRIMLKRKIAKLQ